MAVPGRPVLILMKGHPGTGKSTLAKGLSRKLQIPLVDKDDVRDCTLDLEIIPQVSHGVRTNGEFEFNQGNKELVGIDNTNSRLSSIQLNALSYKVMWQIASRQLEIGLSVVVDCPLARPKLFFEGKAVAESRGALLVILECLPKNDSEWRSRLERRAKMGQNESSIATLDSSSVGSASWHKPSTWQDMEKLLAGYNDCWKYDTGDTPKLTLDTTELSEQDSLEQAVSWVRKIMADQPLKDRT